MIKETMPRGFAYDLFHQKAPSQHLIPALSLRSREGFCFSPMLMTCLGSWWQKAKENILMIGNDWICWQETCTRYLCFLLIFPLPVMASF
jgi:hypothetical protein